MPLVSVVLIFLNEERFLEEAVQSVFDQTLTDWELILVDDGSTDRSTQIAQDFASQDNRIRYIVHAGHANRGMSASRNHGAAQAVSPYLAFLDGDDVWVETKLADQVGLLESMPDVALVVGAMLSWSSWDSAATKRDFAWVPGRIGNRRLDPPEAALTFHPVGREIPGGVDLLVRRTVFETLGGFETRFHGLYEDQAFLFKVVLRYPIYVSSQVWILYRQHSASCISRTTRTDYWRLQGTFLRWLQGEVATLGDPHVLDAVRRARRKIPYRTLGALVHEAIWPRLAALKRNASTRKTSRGNSELASLL